MPKIFHYISIAVLSLTIASATSAMEFKHQAKSIDCQQCHGVTTPSAPAKSKSCMKCHNYEALADKTKAKNPNPHDSHAGQIRCTLCHREHTQSVVYCKECHKNNDPKFDFKTP